MKRRKRTHRKKSGGLSGHTPRRKKSKGLFDGAMSGANLKNSAVNTGLGALGGAGASVGMKLINGITKGNVFGNILSGALVGFVASAMGAPKLGIGFTGGTTALALSGGLKDDSNTEFAEDDVLEEGEIFQTESGELVRMLNDGEMEYLSEEEAQAYLSDGQEVYPGYSTMNTFQN